MQPVSSSPDLTNDSDSACRLKSGRRIRAERGEAKRSFKKDVFPWILAAAGILLVFLFIFKKTVFFGANISWTGHIPLQDSMFNPDLPPRELDCIGDSTAYTLLVPYQRMIRRSLELFGSFPLWNDLNACGLPLIGDPMNFMFSPFSLLRAFASNHIYNVSIVFELFLGALGTLLLSRRLGLSVLPAVFAAFAYILVPFVSKYAELPDQSCIIPWIMLVTVSFAGQGLLRSLLLGIACGATLYVMHAECAFAAVGGAWFLAIVRQLCLAEKRVVETIKSYLASLGLAGLSGCIFALPFLLSMAEFLRNTVCYKSAMDWCRYIQWQAVVFDLFHPSCQGGSFFAGILLLGLIALACFRMNRLSAALAICSASTFWVVCRIFPMDILFHYKPINLFMPVYAAPDLLLFLALLAACGLESLPRQSLRSRLAAGMVFLLSAWLPFVVAAMKVDMHLWQFDAIPPRVFLNEAYVQAGIAAAASALLLLLGSRKGWLSNAFLPLALIALNLLSVSGSFKSALPIISRFDYPETDVLRYLKNQKGRILTVSNHMLLANTNAVYGINDFRVINPFLPARYKDFMMKSGGVRQGLSVFVWGDWNLGPELDLASVKFIVVKDGEDSHLSAERFRLLRSFKGGLKVYKNLKALPEAYLAYSTVNAKSYEESLERIRSAAFDPQHQVVCEFEPGRSTALLQESAPASSETIGPAETKAADAKRLPPITPIADVMRLSPSTVKIRFTAERPGVLVLTDAYFPNWTAKLDGKPLAIFPVNGMFRGVSVDKGEHVLAYEFRSPGFETGLKILALSSGIMLLICCAVIWQKRSAG